MQKTIQDYREATSLLEKYPKDSTKIGYAIFRMSKQKGEDEITNENRVRDYEVKKMEELYDFKVDKAKQDDKNILLKDSDGEFVFSKEDTKLIFKKIQQINKDVRETQIEVTPWFLSDKDCINALSDYEKFILTGFILEEVEQNAASNN